jgi:hypothetical protein
VRDREAGERQRLLSAVAQHGLELGELAPQHPGDRVQLLVDMGGVGLVEDGPQQRQDPRLGVLGDLGGQVAGVVSAAALPRRARQRRPDRFHEARVRVTRGELHTGLHTGQAAGDQ